MRGSGEYPIKKRKTIGEAYLSKTCFKLVLPFLFPGSYDVNVPLAFRTFLALCGVNRALRYWNILRRWIGYLTPPHLRTKLASHSFPIALSLAGLEDFQEHAARELRAFHQGFEFEDFTLTSYWLLNNFFGAHAAQPEMDLVLAGIPFFNIVEATTNARVNEESRRVRCFYAADFAEMALFCYACAVSKDENEKPTDAYLAVAGWKTSDRYGSIFFTAAEKTRFLGRYLLGRLKRIGLTAPQDRGFVEGSLPVTAYSWFCRLCDTSGTRTKATPQERLHRFVRTWFPANFTLTDTQIQEGPYSFSVECE